VPAYTTIRNIIQGVSSPELEAAFRKHAEKLFSSGEGEKIELSFDGKVIRGSFNHFKDQSAIQFLSIFCRNCNLIIAHEEIECKTNEIPVAQKLIQELDIKDALYTCDALSCQTKTLDVVKETGGEIIVQVKKNQKSLLEDCIAITDSNSYIEKYQETYVKAHGRIEARTATTFSSEGLSKKWSRVESIIKIERERMMLNTKSKEWEDKGETSYYISTNLFSAKESNYAIRGHWGIENKNHHVKDATMKEDFSRIRINPQNIARLRSFALNIMRHNKVGNIKAELYSNALDFGNLLKYRGL
jgi:predicted transposase YbfD/YdcC